MAQHDSSRRGARRESEGRVTAKGEIDSELLLQQQRDMLDQGLRYWSMKYTLWELRRRKAASVADQCYCAERAEAAVRQANVYYQPLIRHFEELWPEVADAAKAIGADALCRIIERAMFPRLFGEGNND